MKTDSYAINQCVAGRNLADFAKTSEWLMFCEEIIGTNGSTDDGYMSLGNSFTPRHLDGTTVAFLDGHTKWLRLDGSNKLTPIDYRTAGTGSCPP